MPDSLALSVVAVTAAGLIALAFVWPQGQGARSPAPFGHPLAAIEQSTTAKAVPPATLRGPLKPDVGRKPAKARKAHP
jgi:hypothetical protein